jgi:hypothetical protein
MSFEAAPDGILNKFDRQRGFAFVAGERRRWRAILRRAFQDVEGLHLHGSSYERKTIQVSAGEWFMSDQEEPGAFLWVCSHLGLDPGAIRRRLLELGRR